MSGDRGDMPHTPLRHNPPPKKTSSHVLLTARDRQEKAGGGHGQGTVPKVGSPQECDRSGDERLEGRELEEFCRRLLRRPELEELFGRYSGEDHVLSAEELRDFLRDQGEDASLRQARAVIHTHELNDMGGDEDGQLGPWVGWWNGGCWGGGCWGGGWWDGGMMG